MHYEHLCKRKSPVLSNPPGKLSGCRSFTFVIAKMLNTIINNTNTELMNTKIKEKKSFTGDNMYIGIDVHKNSWSITILTDYLEHKTYNQSSDSSLLISYLKRNFPGGTYLSCYEAGFSGFWLHHELKSVIRHTLPGKNRPGLKCTLTLHKVFSHQTHHEVG